MNALRCLLLPRGNPRRRMPLWLQRLKSLDLLQVVQRFPSFPILVETYREVLQDAFDMQGLKDTLTAISAGNIRIHTVETAAPSPFATSLQFGFVMDWLYGDDTPRAEQRAALLSIDRGLLDEVMGEGSDDITREAIEQTLSERRGTAPGRRARTDDELANLLDRAGDLTEEELRSRIASVDEGVRGDPLAKLLEADRVIAVRLGSDEARTWRFILTETYPRYLSAFGAGSIKVRGGVALKEESAEVFVPEVLRHSAITTPVARREILARFLTQSDPVTSCEIRDRFGWPREWIESRLAEWERTGKLVRGKFRREVQDLEWCSRRVVEIGRRRALAALRSRSRRSSCRTSRRSCSGGSIRREIVSMARRNGCGATTIWYCASADRVGSRLSACCVRAYDSATLSQFTATGEPVWAGEGNYDPESGAIPFARVRFFERGTGGVWLGGGGRGEAGGGRREDQEAILSENAETVRATIAEEGASFIGDIQAITGLTMLAVREAVRELVAWGIVTNDTVEALREISRWKPLIPRTGVDLTSWLPADYNPSPNRRFVRTRPSVRRLPKWRRPTGLVPRRVVDGRWSLYADGERWGPTFLKKSPSESRQWLVRYGIVSRDWWRRERPPVSWRSIYRELKRLEFRERSDVVFRERTWRRAVRSSRRRRMASDGSERGPIVSGLCRDGGK
jgi:ATP-dependent Lhr-like helicase